MHGRFIPLEELPRFEAALAAEIAAGSWSIRRDALAVALGLHGLRVGEVCRARVGDLWPPGNRLHVAEFKRGVARDVPLDRSLVSALLEWRDRSDAPSLLFTRPGGTVHRTQFERAARRLIAHVIGRPLKFHSLRHTFAMRVYAETSDPLLVKQLLGHRSIKSTEVYAASLAAVPAACLVRLSPEPTRPTTATTLRIFAG